MFYKNNKSFIQFSRVFFVLSLSLFLISCREPPPSPVPQEETSACSALSWGGFPRFHPAQKNTDFRCHSNMALEHSRQSKTSFWVAEKLTASNLEKIEYKRTDDFRPDPTLSKNGRAELSDYSGSGWDRGHLAPAADFRHSLKGMSQSFYLSNMVPQDPSNNRGVWAKLEENVRHWTKQRGTLFVWTGPVYEQGKPLGWLPYLKSNEKKNKINRVAIPTHLYKIIVDPERLEMIAFVIPNTSDLPEDAWVGLQVPVSWVEQWTGLHWFERLDENKKMNLHDVKIENWINYKK